MAEIHYIKMKETGWKWIVGHERRMTDTDEKETLTKIEARQVSGRHGPIDAFDLYFDDDLFSTIFEDEVSEIRWNRDYE